MATTERPTDRARRTGRRLVQAIGDELRNARIAAGLSQATAGAPCALSHSEIQRLESGSLRRLDPVRLCCYADVLGLDLSMRLYPAADPLRDRGHAALLERTRRLLHPSLRWRTEVALPIPGDRRAWDATITGESWWRPVEAETRLADGQALARKLSLKLRDGNADIVVVVAADTRHNRSLANAVRTALGPAFEADPAIVRRALADGRDPGTSTLLLVLAGRWEPQPTSAPYGQDNVTNE